jgi:riboflavin kinase / FMN adenylyltransferase
MEHNLALEQYALSASCVTIGAFDGIHLGHRKVIQSLVEQAVLRQLPSIMITFHPHPALALGKIDHPEYLLDLDEKINLIMSLGVDYLITLPFTEAFAEMRAEDFISLLLKHLGMKMLITGDDFTLGKNREGNLKILQELGAKYAFDLLHIPEIDDQGKRISSTYIRELLKQGDLRKANQLLGRIFQFSGIVENGDHRGRKIGFPTANLIPDPERLLPKFGVYATLLQWEQQLFPAITNVGVRPTYYDEGLQVTIETFILDFNETLYDQPITLYMVDFIRPEEKFSSSEALHQQIEKDIQTAREMLAHANQEKNLFTGSATITP